MPKRSSAGSPPDVQRALDAVRRIVRELRVSDRAAESQVGLSAAQLFVLQQLKGAEQLTMSELAQRTSTDPSSVSTVVKRLAAQGLVTRTRSSLDERRVEVALHPRGAKLLAAAPDVAQHRLLAALTQLAPARRRSLAKLLEEVVAAMGGGDGAAPMFFEGEAKDVDAKPARKRRTR